MPGWIILKYVLNIVTMKKKRIGDCEVSEPYHMDLKHWNDPEYLLIGQKGNFPNIELKCE